jgi:hypothetical protein
MTAAAPPTGLTAMPSPEPLPAPVSGQRHEIASSVGRLSYYAASTGTRESDAPLLLIHSINAAGSAYEIKPLYEHYRKTRTVYALELPGFGHSQRGKRIYTIRMMTDAIHKIVETIRKDHGPAPIDVVGLSLSCEFLARAITENPLAYRSAALISPTGFSTAPKASRWRDGTRGKPWLHALFERPLWSRGFFRLLTSRRGIAFFLKKTWGSDNFDRGLADYDYLTTHQEGAQHAPYYFVSGFLFSEDVMRIYHSLTLPVWMAHGMRGDFVNYKNKKLVEGRANWTIDVFDTGAMPHFEATDKFVAAYDTFRSRQQSATGASTN